MYTRSNSADKLLRRMHPGAALKLTTELVTSVSERDRVHGVEIGGGQYLIAVRSANGQISITTPQEAGRGALALWQKDHPVTRSLPAWARDLV